MKLMESLPIVFVGVAAFAVLAFDDVPAWERIPPPEKRPAPALMPVKAVPLVESLLPTEALLADDAVQPPTEAPTRKVNRVERESPAGGAPKRDVAMNKAPVPRSRIEVEERRSHPDQHLQQSVMRAITRQPNLSGQIAVEARDAVVRLSGWTLTPGQSLRAEKAAARVDGVRHVVNEIRPRMGVISS